jgi:hypothetical protein
MPGHRRGAVSSFSQAFIHVTSYGSKGRNQTERNTRQNASAEGKQQNPSIDENAHFTRKPKWSPQIENSDA